MMYKAGLMENQPNETIDGYKAHTVMDVPDIASKEVCACSRHKSFSLEKTVMSRGRVIKRLSS